MNAFDMLVRAVREALGTAAEVTCATDEVSVDLALKHGVISLVSEVRSHHDLQAAARQNALLSLSKAHYLGRLAGALRGAGVDYIAVKGPCLALEAYGDLGRRQFTDLDLLVRWKQLPAAVEVLREFGLSMVEPLDHLIDRAEAGHPALPIAFTFTGETAACPIDLHAMLSHRLGFTIDHEGIFLSCREVQIAGFGVNTLGMVEGAHYLCVHGTQHGWGRLGWVVDAGLMLQRLTDAEAEELLDYSAARGSARMVALAASLAVGLLGLELSSCLREAASRHGVDDGLYQRALGLLQDDGPSANKGASKLLALQFRAWDSFPIAIGHLVATLLSPTWTDYAAIKLPPWGFWAYRLVRPLRILTSCWSSG